MKKTGYLHDNRYLLHDTGPYHPEMAERLTAVYNGIKDAGLLDQLTLLPDADSSSRKPALSSGTSTKKPNLD